MQYSDISVERQGTTGILRFARPEAMNAARLQTHEEIRHALSALEADDTVRVIVVTGEGRAFCAGTDLSAGFRLPVGGDPASGAGIPPDVGGLAVLQLYRCGKPVIAAINGAAVGFGITFTLAMDIRIAAAGAKFAFPFTRRGICAESCSSWFLPRLVGMQTAQEWMLSGRTFLAEEALERGLVREVLPAEEVLPRALEIAREIAEQTSPASVALTRRLLWQMAGADHPEVAHRYESRGVAARVGSADAAEGVASFRERRLPAFTSTPAEVSYMTAWWDED